MLTDHFVTLRLWTAATLGSLGTLTSAAIPIFRFKRLESLIFQLTVGAGNPDIKIEYAPSLDGVTVGAYITLIASTNTSYAATPSGLNLVPMTAPLADYFFVKLTELASKATTVTMTCEARE